jgi:ABC-type amino acid transport substrate-binding protein
MRETSVKRITPPARRGVRCALAGVAGIALSLAACAAHHATDAARGAVPPALRAGIAPNFPPLAFVHKGEPAGVEADFARQLGPALGTQVTLVAMPWEDLIPALREHRIDLIMSGMSITPERQQLVSFAHPYLRVGQMLALRRADAARLPNQEAIDQPAVRVGFVSGTTSAAYVHEHLRRAQPVGVASVAAGAAALRGRQIDVFVGDAPSIYRITTRHRGLVGRYEPLTEEYLAWAVRQDDEALRARLDAVLTRWNSDGTLEAVLGKWITVRKPPSRGTSSSR